ncbi:unnamed protein product [Nesidiocoris tenuis]|uniref:Uncharacterized protein n=1 Tax=Nesidiocoris tenuis TaxID=355587 RepID=A0A6H5HN60_9HEMI|nr:unnamed protein product [Nesidiocoris tenuis]
MDSAIAGGLFSNFIWLLKFQEMKNYSRIFPNSERLCTIQHNSKVGGEPNGSEGRVIGCDGFLITLVPHPSRLSDDSQTLRTNKARPQPLPMPTSQPLVFLSASPRVNICIRTRKEKALERVGNNSRVW